MSSFPCFECGLVEISIGFGVCILRDSLGFGHSREMAFGIHKEKGQLGILTCDTQN